MAKILGSLPAKYNNLITAWNSVSPANQTVGNLLERLIKEENKMEIADEATNALSTLKISKKFIKNSRNSSDNNNNKNDKFQVEYYYYKKKAYCKRMSKEEV
jgi:hypothetical protein